MLLLIEERSQIKIYMNSFNVFNLFQTITPHDGALNTDAGAITDDHQWVVFGTTSGTI